MRFLYCDSGLLSDLGHHRQSQQALCRELGYRNIPHVVYGFQQCTESLENDGVRPYFRANCYYANDGDAICGWMTAFLQSADLTRIDLTNLGLFFDDILYWNSAQPAQLWGIIQWMSQFQPQSMPSVVVELGTDPGLDIQLTSEGGMKATTRDPRIDARATLWHFCGLHIPDHVLPKLSIVTFDEGASGAYQSLLGRPVSTLAVPRDAVGPVRKRTGKPITLGSIGHQRGERGSHLLPQIIEKVLAENTGVKFFVHDGSGDNEELHRRFVEMQAIMGDFEYDNRVADEKLWARLLGKVDLMVLPYDPQRFAVSYSAVCAEAIANGIPMVVPMGTSMSRWCDKFFKSDSWIDETTGAGFGCGSTSAVYFASWEVDDIVRATTEAIKNFDWLAVQAERSAARWAETQGASRCMDGILQLAGFVPSLSR